MAAGGGARLLEAVAARRIVLFCGKGGVGKTTLAAAVSLALVDDESFRAARGGGIRLLGTDPAHTLPRVLDRSPADASELVPGLEVRQVLADELLERFRARHQATLARIVEEGTYLSAEDARALLSSSLPGADEVLSLLELAGALDEDDASAAGAEPRVTLVDTAPSAHARRLVALPRGFDAALAVLETMREKARVVASALAGAAVEDDADRLLDRLRARTDRLLALLSDPGAGGFVVVARPDPASVAEAASLARDLAAGGLAPCGMILNAALEPFDSARDGPGETPCCARARRLRERADAAWDELARGLPDVPRVRLPRLAREPVGVDALRELGRRIARAPAETSAGARAAVVGGEATLSTHIALPGGHAFATPDSPAARALRESPLPDAVARARITVVGGKGGVGKTTLAARIALARAVARPDARVLLASVAGGGLGRVLDMPVGDDPRPVALGLRAVEVDALARYERLKAAFRDDLHAAFERLMGGSLLQPTYDRAILEGVLELAPPGIDEIAALALLGDALDEHEAVVVDAAPTGHLVRFLELPGVARRWLTLVLRLLDHHPEIATAETTLRIVELLATVRRIARTLEDAEQTALVIAAVAGDVIADETRRLRARASAAGVPPALLVVNRVPPPSGCATCEARREALVRDAGALAADLAPAPACFVHEADREPRGLEALAALRLRGGPAARS